MSPAGWSAFDLSPRVPPFSLERDYALSAMAPGELRFDISLESPVLRAWAAVLAWLETPSDFATGVHSSQVIDTFANGIVREVRGDFGERTERIELDGKTRVAKVEITAGAGAGSRYRVRVEAGEMPGLALVSLRTDPHVGSTSSWRAILEAIEKRAETSAPDSGT